MKKLILLLLIVVVAVLLLLTVPINMNLGSITNTGNQSGNLAQLYESLPKPKERTINDITCETNHKVFNCSNVVNYFAGEQFYYPINFFLVGRQEYIAKWKEFGGVKNGWVGSFCFTKPNGGVVYVYCDAGSTFLKESKAYRNTVVAHELLEATMRSKRRYDESIYGVHDAICGESFCKEFPGKCRGHRTLYIPGTSFCDCSGGLDYELGKKIDFVTY